MGLFPSTIADPEADHVPTPSDVDAVRSTLTRFVPVELANLIIEYAMYWPRVSYSTAVNNQTWMVTQDIGPTCCALTPKIATMVDLQLREGTFWKVKRVVFKITSHDQGWCSDNNFREPYAGSWTWFEAAIAREVDENVLPETEKTRRNDIQDCIRSVVSKEPLAIPKPDGHQICTVDNVRTGKEHSPVWHIQRNIRASKEFMTHEVVWEDDEPLDWMDNVPGEEMRFVDATGAGKGRGFVSKLEPQDRIAVIARALYPGWTNYLQDVEVDIYYSV